MVHAAFRGLNLVWASPTSQTVRCSNLMHACTLDLYTPRGHWFLWHSANQSRAHSFTRLSLILARPSTPTYPDVALPWEPYPHPVVRTLIPSTRPECGASAPGEMESPHWGIGCPNLALTNDSSAHLSFHRRTHCSMIALFLRN